MIEELYFYTCNFCDVESKSVHDFKSHVNKVHFPANCSEPQNVTSRGANVKQEVPISENEQAGQSIVYCLRLLRLRKVKESLK